MINFTKEQGLLMTNTCNLRCHACINNKSYNSTWEQKFSKQISDLLSENHVKKAWISGGEIFVRYKELIDLIEELSKNNISISRLYSNGYIEKFGKTEEFLEFLENKGEKPAFIFSLDDMHGDNIDLIISFIKKYSNVSEGKIIINSASFEQVPGNNLSIFIKKIQQIGVKLEDSGRNYKTYSYKNISIQINIKGLLQVNEVNIGGNSLINWDYKMVKDKNIRVIGYDKKAYFDPVFAYAGLGFAYYMHQSNNKLSIGNLDNEELFNFITSKPLGELFERVQAVNPWITKEHFAVDDELIMYILKNKLDIVG